MKTVRDEVREALNCSALWPRYTPAEQADILKDVVAVHSRPDIHRYRFSHLAQALEDAGFFDRMLIEQP
jgi:hypothetical protein